MKKDVFVVFHIKDEGKEYETKVYTKDLRKALENAKVKEDMDVELSLKYKDKTSKVCMKVSDIRKIIKQSETTLNVVPKSLSQYLVDLTQQLPGKNLQPISGRENEIEKIWFYLSQKTKNDVFLVGEKDVGKTAIAYEIARQISTNECPKEFYDTRILMLKTEMLLKIKSDFELKYVVNRILKFLKENRDSTILFIDKALYMKMDELLIMMLYCCIKKLNIPMITTSSEEDFTNYFLQDPVISKYINDIYIEEPELYELEPMLEKHILRLKKQYKLDISGDMVKFGIVTSELSNSVSANPGKVINIFERAFLEAKRKEKECVDRECILSCYDSYLKLYNSMTEETKKTTAYHETGHYLLFVKSPYINDTKVAFVSILPMMNFLGVTWQYHVRGENTGYTRDYCVDYIASYLAGRIAEKEIINEYSTSASSDLEYANRIAEMLIMRYGILEEDGLKNRCYFINDYFVKDYLISDEKKQRLDEEVQKLVDEGYARAEKIIKENRELLNIIAERLLKDEILTGEQLETICKEYEKNK